MSERIYAQKHRIRSGEHTITGTVPRAGIAPCVVLIDLTWSGSTTSRR